MFANLNKFDSESLIGTEDGHLKWDAFFNEDLNLDYFQW